MSINFHSESIELPDLNYKKVIKCINKKGKSQSIEIKELNYIFCSEQYILELNMKFLNHDYFTDVITFKYDNNNKIEADIFISPQTVKSNSELYKVSLESENLRVIFHGYLHLLGYNDSSEEEKLNMRLLENEMIFLYSTLK